MLGGVESSFHVGKNESRSAPFRAASGGGGVASLSPSRVLAFVSELAELRVLRVSLEYSQDETRLV